MTPPPRPTARQSRKLRASRRRWAVIAAVIIAALSLAVLAVAAAPALFAAGA
jgi:hypothetical protein